MYQCLYFAFVYHTNMNRMSTTPTRSLIRDATFSEDWTTTVSRLLGLVMEVFASFPEDPTMHYSVRSGHCAMTLSDGNFFFNCRKIQQAS